MEFPVIFHIGSLSVPAHAIFEILAYTTGYRYYLYLRRRIRDPITDGRRMLIFIAAAAGALFGSRLLAVLESPQEILQARDVFLYILSNKTIVGGLLGGLIGVELIKKIVGETRSSGDLITYPLILGMIIGRIGCFLHGTAESVYGAPTNAWYGMDLGDGIPRHSLPLYEIVFLVVVWYCISMGERSRSYPEGVRFQIFMTVYLVLRFLLEFLKPDMVVVAGLSSIQIACLCGLLYYHRTMLNLLFRRNELYGLTVQP